jgi:hypothetical protein
MYFFTVREIVSKITNKAYMFTRTKDDCRIRRGRVSLCKGLMVGGVSKQWAMAQELRTDTNHHSLCS